mmetsp:Transcript_2724/g.3747  ORF Transcript_2724/g.3747 Transcript_2724/m.3747 type:complete len:313 (-) Transcript_2724:154-1092(-)
MLKNVKKSEELLRGLSAHHYTYYTIRDYGKAIGSDMSAATADLVSSAFGLTWMHFYGLIQTMFTGASVDAQGLASCLQLLKNCIAVSILLDMTEELNAFLAQLARVKLFVERREEFLLSPPDARFTKEEWFVELQEWLADETGRGTLLALDRLNDIMDELDDALHVDAEHRRDMNRVARRIREGHELLNDPTRFFVKEGDLIKKSRKLGRQTKYRFFLFSDILIYSKHIPGTNEFKIHDELPLHCLKLVDWFPSKNGSNKHSNSFEIHHPRKSFWVVCSSERERMDWVATIRSTCEEHSRRLAQLTAQQNGL